MSTSMEKLNLFITFAAGIICLSPIFALEMQKIYPANGISPNPSADLSSYHGPSVGASFFIAIVPAADFLLDFVSYIASYLYPDDKSLLRRPDRSVVIRLNDLERLQFILGVGVRSTIWFLDPSADWLTQTIVIRSTSYLSTLLVLCPILTFLQRSTTTYTKYSTLAQISTVCTGFSMIALANFFQSDHNVSITLTLLGLSLTILSGVIHLTLISLCAYKYCCQKLRTSQDRQSVLEWLSDPFERSKTFNDEKAEKVVESEGELYINYIPALHMLSSLFLIAALIFSALAKDPSRIQTGNFVIIMAEVLILVIELRIRKNEIARGLIALLKSKKSYVRYISHELRTPLNTAFLGLKLLTSDLKMSRDPGDAERYTTLCDVNMSCAAAVDILNDLLCYEKLESGVLELHRENILVEPFLKDCVSMFSAQARNGNVDLLLSTDTDNVEKYTGGVTRHMAYPLLPHDRFFADKFKMDQVIRNLISNALKFTAEGGSVTVSAAFIPDPSGLADEKEKRSPHTRRSKRSNYVAEHAVTSGCGDFPRSSYYRDSRRVGVAKACDPLSRSVTIQGRLVVAVTDTGVGISKVNQARLFKEIIQFSPEKLQAGGGSGLGLWITRGILDLHDGTIRVYSEGEGCGSTFLVEMPMVRPVNATSREATSSTMFTEKRKSINLKKFPMEPLLNGSSSFDLSLTSSDQRDSADKFLTPTSAFDILVVDDSRLNRKMLLRCLRADGHTCEEGVDGLEAIAMVKAKIDFDNGGSGRPYDVILMDFVMPNMDGPTATLAIRELGYTGPIFGVTGNGLPSDVAYFLSCGADRVILKPLDTAAFSQMMREV